jgi:hypothetical protein
MFFWVAFGNAEKRMLNLDCRCSIVVDHMFRALVMGACAEYIESKTREVAHAKEEIGANLAFLEGQLGGGAKVGAENAGESGASGAAAPAASPSLAETNPEMAADIQAKIDKLGELLKTREFQSQALAEAATKCAGASAAEIDVCDDTGTVLGLQGMDSVQALDVLEARGVYTLCRRVKPEGGDGGGTGIAKKKGGAAAAATEKTVMLSFAVPPDDAVNLEALLGPSRITVEKRKRRGRGEKGHRRSSTTRPKGKGKEGRSMKDITNGQQKAAGKGKHRRSRTTL